MAVMMLGRHKLDVANRRIKDLEVELSGARERAERAVKSAEEAFLKAARQGSENDRVLCALAGIGYLPLRWVENIDTSYDANALPSVRIDLGRIPFDALKALQDGYDHTRRP